MEEHLLLLACPLLPVVLVALREGRQDVLSKVVQTPPSHELVELRKQTNHDKQPSH
jgi:hypothetical protein